MFATGGGATRVYCRGGGNFAVCVLLTFRALVKHLPAVLCICFLRRFHVPPGFFDVCTLACLSEPRVAGQQTVILCVPAFRKWGR